VSPDPASQAATAEVRCATLTIPLHEESDMTLSYRFEGTGDPLLLLHAFGLDKEEWRPVVPLLAPHRRVLVVDLPGHGGSPMPPAGVPASPRGYASVIGALLDELGLDQIDVAGNSIGGWAALELALAGRASSVVALSPAGLWEREPLTRVLSFIATWVGTRLARPVLPRLLSDARWRQRLLGEAMAAAGSLSPDDALAVAGAFPRTQHLLTHLWDRRGARFAGGRELTIPVTLAWGAQDQFIPPVARHHLDELPDHLRVLELAHCGHVMTWDDPELVATTILEGAAPGRRPR
jgi:pimeloyl-ACP methyl ester carboxylesterase